jgi:hypothetical protein
MANATAVPSMASQAVGSADGPNLKHGLGDQRLHPLQRRAYNTPTIGCGLHADVLLPRVFNTSLFFVSILETRSAAAVHWCYSAYG